MKYHELYHRNEQYFVLGNSLKEAKQKFATEHVYDIKEVQSAFRHNLPMLILKWGIGITALGLGFLVAYLIF